jgi:DNA polymerase-3 subunit delta'
MIPPAQLWIGKPLILHSTTVEYLQKLMCKNNGCSFCTTCLQLKQQQHYDVLWLQPEKTQYTISSIEPIFQTIAYTVAPDQNFFIILQKADLLTQQCANSLLKSLEEPPTGYHFILLAEREDQILPTIHSRCVVKRFKDISDISEQSPLFTFFTMKDTNPLQFLQILEKENLSDRQAFELIETVLEFWRNKYQTAVQQNDQEKATRAEHKIAILTQSLEKPPMPGSAKLFLKNLFLTIQ